jgi:hypothetical protein
LSSRFQATTTIAVGCVLAVVGGWWAVSVACCSGRPREAAIVFAAFGLALAGFGTWSFRGGGEPRGFLRRNSLWATTAMLAIGSAALAHAVIGTHEERTFVMRWEESVTYFGGGRASPPGAAPSSVVLGFESRPDYFLRVDDERLAGFLRASSNHRVEATLELTFVFGTMKTLRLLRVGEKSSPVGFEVTSGVRGDHPGDPPWE